MWRRHLKCDRKHFTLRVCQEWQGNSSIMVCLILEVRVILILQMRTRSSEVSPQQLIMSPYKLHIEGFMSGAELGDWRSKTDLRTLSSFLQCAVLLWEVSVLWFLHDFKFLSFNSRVRTIFPFTSTYFVLWKWAWTHSDLCKVSTISKYSGTSEMMGEMEGIDFCSLVFVLHSFYMSEQ